MLRAASAPRGMVTAPHHLAAEAGVSVLREGGNAIEAMIAAAATVAVVYPHMNSLGGDGFWLIKPRRRDPVAIMASGPAARRISCDVYGEAGLGAIPGRGPLAAITVAGCIGGWDAAMVVSTELNGRMPLPRLLEDAIWYANSGFPVTRSQAENFAAKQAELAEVAGFADTFQPGSNPADVYKQPRIAATLQGLASAGLDDFYRGKLAASLAHGLERVGSPLRADDLGDYKATVAPPLSVKLSYGTVFNTPPPTQGLASLMILGVFDRLHASEADSFDHLHGLVEATKRSFLVRDREVCDPALMTSDPAAFLDYDYLGQMAKTIDPRCAMTWPAADPTGDTVWLGAIDAEGTMVSYIQSIYWEFGSGVVLDETGVLWQNRGASFSLDPRSINYLAPGKQPFHTLNPALAVLNDGRQMVYGTMGGEGQPQTQAAVLTRMACFGQDVQAAITAPRWLLGRTWGAQSTSLKLEHGFPAATVQALVDAGHDVETLPAFSEAMGHAGGVVRLANGMLEGASDPRSDGRAAGF